MLAEQSSLVKYSTPVLLSGNTKNNQKKKEKED